MKYYRRKYDMCPKILAKLKENWQKQNEIFWQNQEEESERMATKEEIELLEFFKKAA